LGDPPGAVIRPWSRHNAAHPNDLVPNYSSIQTPNIALPLRQYGSPFTRHCFCGGNTDVLRHRRQAKAAAIHQRQTDQGAVWGKIIGGVTGFAMGGPLGAVVGAAIGHAAETGGFGQFAQAPDRARAGGWTGRAVFAALPTQREQVFAIGVVVLAAKLAKCDGPVRREEIAAFRRCFRIPPEAVRDIGRLFDQARASADGYQPYADQLGVAFADNRGLLEEVLAALFAIARADGPVNRREQGVLSDIHRGFGLDGMAWSRASGVRPEAAAEDADEDPYAVLGIGRNVSDEAMRAAWRQLVRENHPDGLAGRGVPAEFVARATAKVARINAAWDRIKRERGL
jgi:DnaJ like chaperone protein